jgi:hypothetical protein
VRPILKQARCITEANIRPETIAECKEELDYPRTCIAFDNPGAVAVIPCITKQK